MKRLLLLFILLSPLLSMGQWAIENTQITSTLSQFGTSASMSNDGQIIAVWSEDGLGTAIALSKDANYIAISVPRNTDNNNAGRIEIYNYDGTEWVEVFGVTGPAANQEIGAEPRSLSISSNGRCFSIGNPDNNEVTVYCNSAILNVNAEIFKNEMYLTPNPSKNMSTLYLQNKYSNVQLDIYNLLGRKVHQEDYFNCDKLSIDTSKFNTGIYIVKLNILGKIKTLKLLVD